MARIIETNTRLVMAKDKKHAERIILNEFLSAYYMRYGKQLRIVRTSEKPDFICQDPSTKERIGVELCELLFEPDRKKQAVLDAMNIAIHEGIKEKATISWGKVGLLIFLKRIPNAKERQELAHAIVTYIERVVQQQKPRRSHGLFWLRKFSNPVLQKSVKELGVQKDFPMGPLVSVHHHVLTHQFPDDHICLLLDTLMKKKTKGTMYATEHPTILILYMEREPLLDRLLNDQLMHSVRTSIEWQGLRGIFNRIYIFYVRLPTIIEL